MKQVDKQGHESTKGSFLMDIFGVMTSSRKDAGSIPGIEPKCSQGNLEYVYKVLCVV